MSSSHQSYRPEIDGLRALAVMAVILFHVDAAWLPGGYTGVDVFFVISGFLITANIRRDLAAGQFSFARFYGRRYKRLAPALIVTVLATLAASVFILTPQHLLLATQASIASLFSVSNIFFWLESGYLIPMPI